MVVVVVVVVIALGGCCGRGAPKVTGVTMGREVVAIGDAAVAAAAMQGVLAVLHADAAGASAMAGAGADAPEESPSSNVIEDDEDADGATHLSKSR